jgi:hypothetical protein
MRVGLLSALGMLLLAAGCASAAPVQPAPAASHAAVVTTATAPKDADVDREVTQLRAALLHEVPHHTTDTAVGELAWISRAKVVAAAASLVIDRPLLLVVTDRNPAVQELRIILARPDAPWQVIGGSKVSTGQSGRRGYFITPVGVFLHTDDILDYRALGTFNENHIRGLGLKGMRVWDFGWQTAARGWGLDRDLAEIRLQMHATDPDYLEQRLGRPASEGCIRIPAAMNRFLDVHGVLDADYERAARDDARLGGVLLREREPTPLAGNALVVIDSSQDVPSSS